MPTQTVDNQGVIPTLRESHRPADTSDNSALLLKDTSGRFESTTPRSTTPQPPSGISSSSSGSGSSSSGKSTSNAKSATGGALGAVGDALSKIGQQQDRPRFQPATADATTAPPIRLGQAPSMKHGGVVPKEGLYHLHKDETVIPAEQGSRVPKRVPAKNPKYPGQMCSSPRCKGTNPAKNLREETRKDKDCPPNQCLAGAAGTIAQISGVPSRPASPNKHNDNVIVRGKVLKYHEKPDIEEDCGY